ncbi:MAG: hypothetical protein OSJ58_10505 [Dysosmobacter sp.]|nr:hypothetical protein [Dysosmobacter sp.]
MKLSLNRAEFLSAVKHGESIAPRDSALDILKGLLLEADSASGKLTITATNLEITLEQKIPCSVSEDGAIVLNARLAASMLEKLAGDVVTLERIPGKLLLYLRGSDAEYLIPIWERNSYPKLEIPFPEDTVLVGGIPGMARRTVFAAAQDNNKPLMKCVNLKFTKDGLRAAVGNGNCIVAARGDDKSTGNISLLLPAHSLEKLARMCCEEDEFHVGTTGKAIVFFQKDFAYSARLLEGDYIDADRIIGSIQNQFTVLTGVQELRKALDSASCVDTDGKVCLRFEGQRLTFCCRSERGNTAVALDVVPLTGMPRGEYWYIAKQLMLCLKSLAGTVKLGVAQGSMLTLETENAYYMQTGVRPEAAVQKKEKKKPARKAA